MKTKIGFLVALLFAGIFSANAQGGGMQRRTVEERVKMVMDKLEPLKLDKEQATKTESVITDMYKDQEKKMEEMRNGGGTFDREAMMAARKKMMEERDEKLKKIFTEDQFKKFKDEIEPAMQPQRNGGGGAGKN